MTGVDGDSCSPTSLFTDAPCATTDGCRRWMVSASVARLAIALGGEKRADWPKLQMHGPPA
jgi:hypothetical protein